MTPPRISRSVILMSKWKLALSLVLTLALAARVSAQHHGDHQPGTTVQLPTFSFFTVSTSVSVPDRGSASLGGVNRMSSGSSTYGPFPTNRASGTGASAGGMSVHVTIHDFDAMDTAVLRQAGMTPAQIDSLRLGKTQNESVAGSVADVRRQQIAAFDKQQQEAADYLRRGQAAEAEGKTNVAKIFYQMAARRASGELKVEIQRHLDGAALARSGARPAQK